MFEVLSEKLNSVFRVLGNRGKLNEKDIDEALREVRLALLEADVNFKVVKDFTNRVKERSVGKEVMERYRKSEDRVSEPTDSYLTDYSRADRVAPNSAGP